MNKSYELGFFHFLLFCLYTRINSSSLAEIHEQHGNIWVKKMGKCYRRDVAIQLEEEILTNLLFLRKGPHSLPILF